MGSVEGGYVGQGVGRPQDGADFARDGGHDSSVRVDGGGDAGVGVAQQPAFIFDGPHAGLLQVLGVGAAVAVPAVIGNIDEDLRAVGGELADFVGKNGFVADEHAELVAAGIERLARAAAGKIADLLSQSSG